MSNEEQAVSSDDLVAVPRGLLGAALHAIRMQVEAPGTFAELRRYTTGDLARSGIVHAVSEAEPKCHKCGTPMVRNPHPDAGKMHRMLEVGCPLECLPCTVLSRHQWSTRAYAAEKALRDSAANSRTAGDGEAGAAPEIGPHDLHTSAGGRGYVAEYFVKRLKRNDFTYYIRNTLAADFACALAQHLAAPPEKQTSHSEGDAAQIARWKRDSELLGAIQDSCWDVRFKGYSNGDAGDYDIGIEIVGQYMGAPHERVLGENYNENLRAALEQAMTADAYPPARPEYDEHGRPVKGSAPTVPQADGDAGAGAVTVEMCAEIIRDATRWRAARAALAAAKPERCQCPACANGTSHASDCAVHNAPAYPPGPCDCEASDDAATIQRMGGMLAEIAIALKGPEKALHRHGYADLPELAHKMAIELAVYRQQSGGDAEDKPSLLGELTDDLIEILGRPNFTCIRIAQLFRLSGQTIPQKAEAEQAAVIYFLLRAYLRHGKDWSTHADAELNAMAKAARAQRAGKGANDGND